MIESCNGEGESEKEKKKKGLDSGAGGGAVLYVCRGQDTSDCLVSRVHNRRSPFGGMHGDGRMAGCFVRGRRTGVRARVRGKGRLAVLFGRKKRLVCGQRPTGTRRVERKRQRDGLESKLGRSFVNEDR